MSHFMFGSFSFNRYSENQFEMLKQEFLSKGLILYINEEINFCNDINKMLLKYKVENTINYCITSVNQVYNSEDLLFPYDKYTNEELFPVGNERDKFNELCALNIEIVKNTLIRAIKLAHINNLQIFVVNGYDTEFRIIKCSIDEMFSDLLSQVKVSYSLSSTIYEID